MSLKIEVVAIGDSPGVQFPDSVVKSLHLERGDVLLLDEAADGLELKPLESVEMRVMKRVMRENREVLKMLADS